MIWFDTHAHLSDAQFDPDRDLVVLSAIERGVSFLVEIADGPDEWPKAQALAERFASNVWWAAGLHPYYAHLSSELLWSELVSISRHPRFVAVGEVGLDYAKSSVPAEVQKTTFSRAIEVAMQINKPLVIHCRNAYHDLHPILERYFPMENRCPGVVHCFSGSMADAERLISMGFYLGVDGPLTYPSAKELRDIFARIPLSRVVLETDSPYLPPQPKRGQRNDPSGLLSVGEKLAEIRQVDLTTVARETVQNGFDLFRLNRSDMAS